MSKRIFLDHASTTPLDKAVFKAMKPFYSKNFQNPSAIYREGKEIGVVVEKSRQTIAGILNVRPEEIIFTGSGTESDNLAILGVFNVFKKDFKPHIITTNIEHPAILEACRFVEREGGEVTYVEVEENGIVDPKKIAKALKPNTVLVSIMYANNEIGTIQPLREIAKVIEDFKSDQNSFPYFHTDASQAANYLDLSFQKLRVDMMTLDASKIYGPKGIGLLASRRFVSLKPMILGGGQEKGLRAGTENVPNIVGMALALEKTQEIKEKESERLNKLRNYFFSEIQKIIPDSMINGDCNKRLPNNVNICVPGLDAEFAVIKLDVAGICCSSASSCMNLSGNSYSYVVQTLGEAGNKCKESSLRFSFGRGTTKRELDLTLSKIQSIIVKK